MSATKEEIQQENAMYDRLTNTVTEALLTLPTKDLNQWNFRAMRFEQVDKIIADVLESEKVDRRYPGSTFASCYTASLLGS